MRLHAKALREIRIRSGMTVTALAEAAGIKQSHLSNVEAGRRHASDEVIVALARALKVELPAILADPPDEVDTRRRSSRNPRPSGAAGAAPSAAALKAPD